MLTFDRLRQVNVARCEAVFHKLHDWTPTDWATAMAGESGEACNKIKKLRRLDGADAAMKNDVYIDQLLHAIADELADTVIYCDLLAARLKIDLGQAIIDKFNEVSLKKNTHIRL